MRTVRELNIWSDPVEEVEQAPVCSCLPDLLQQAEQICSMQVLPACWVRAQPSHRLIVSPPKSTTGCTPADKGSLLPNPLSLLHPRPVVQPAPFVLSPIPESPALAIALLP